MLRTKIIAGHKITLEEGIQYRASRPFDDGQRTSFPVSILKQGKSVFTITHLDYNQANKLVNEFNNRATHQAGRVW